MVHLYDLDFKGYTSCFECKLKGGKSYGKCAMNDGLTPILEKLPKTDAFLLGSPIYFGTVTGEMHSFLERLLFQYLVYSRPAGRLSGRRLTWAPAWPMRPNKRHLFRPEHGNLARYANERRIRRIRSR